MSKFRLNKEEAHKLLLEASSMNPGRWVEHSIKVAEIAERLAMTLNLDKEKAYVFGLMHDIGRREGITGTRHAVDGYKFLQQLGYSDVARYCITHGYLIKNVKHIYGRPDMSEEETNFVQEYLDNVEYDIYDKLVQLGDALGLPEGITIMERRLLDVNLRHGVSDITVEDWKAKFKLQAEIESMLGYSIYKVFPEVERNLSIKLIKDLLEF